MITTPSQANIPSILLTPPVPDVTTDPTLPGSTSALPPTADAPSQQPSAPPIPLPSQSAGDSRASANSPTDNPLEAIDLQALIATAGDPAALASLLHAKSRPVDFDMLPPLHTIQSAAGNKLQMDVVKMPAAIMQMAFNGIYIPLSMLTTAALDRIRSNDNLRYKKIPFGNGVGKQSLDDSFFPAEESLDTATFLQAYQNWLSVVDKLADAALAKGWHCHHARMLADTAFAQHLSAWRMLDRTLRAQFTDKPFLVDPNDPTYFAMFERARNSIPQRAISYSDARPPRSS
ncbi:hypothetical protein JB92DRAFT_2831525 [Gautieria morchelliformis]|nr:hypothetical protein JB92DRAFT_2831525 [Gautieria morchelliformis]